MNSNQWKYLLSGFLILLAGAYLDCVRGPLVPILKDLFEVSYSDISWYLVLGNLAATVFTFLLIPLLNRFSERNTALALCALTLAVIALAHRVESFTALLSVGTLFGIVISMIGTIANILVIKGTSPTNRARCLCGLHIMFTVGALAAPALVTLALSEGIGWAWIQGGVGIPLLAGVILLLVLAGKGKHTETIETEPIRITRLQAIILMAFGTYVGGEVLISMWMTTYLHEYRDLSIAEAAPYLSGFFVMMCLTRLLCLTSLKPEHEKRVLMGSLIAATLFFILGHLGFLWAFSAAGILGPFFPLYLSRISNTFPNQWRSLTTYAITAMQAVLALVHLSVGELTEQFGIANAYTGPLILLMITLVGVVIYFEWEKKILRDPKPIWN